MATAKFLLQSKSTNAPIYLRLSLGRGNSIKRKTGLNINFKDWSKSTAFPKQNDEFNKVLILKLRKLETHILNEINNAQSIGVEINGVWLAANIDEFFNRKQTVNLEYLTNFGEYFIDKLKNKSSDQGKRGVSISTRKKYRTIVNKLIAFEDYRNKLILIKDIDLKFRDELIEYFDQVDNLNDNTIGRYLKFVKSICLDAARNGIETNKQLDHFKGFTVKTPKVTLSFSELEKIKTAEFNNENHIIARDWLIIGCYTGQRVSDLLRMNKGFIDNIQNFDFIVLEQIKTGKIVQIPIHSEVKKVLDKYDNNFPPLFTNNTDSNKAMFNRYLKQLCQIAEVNAMVEGNLFNEVTGRTQTGIYEKYKLVSSHICRRSFATNFYGNPKYPTPLLMNITAHSTEKMFLDYIGKKPIDYGLQLAKIWANEALRKEKEPQLKIVNRIKSK